MRSIILAKAKPIAKQARDRQSVKGVPKDDGRIFSADAITNPNMMREVTAKCL